MADEKDTKTSEVATEESVTCNSTSSNVVTSTKEVECNEKIGEVSVIINSAYDHNTTFDEHKKKSELEAGTSNNDSNDINVTIEEQKSKEIEGETANAEDIELKTIISDKLNDNNNDSDCSQDEDEWEMKQTRIELDDFNKDKTSCCAETSSPSKRGAAITPEKHMLTSQSWSSSSVDLNEDESSSVVPMTKSSLPYFHLPKPNLDDFLVETEKKLSITDSKESSACQKKTFEPPNNGNIVFDLPGELESNHDKKSSPAVSFYEKMKSINDVEDSTPGIKRTLLKDYLKKEIEEKKLAAFNRRKESEKINNELDEELDFEPDESYEADHESSEDEDVETVSFDKEDESHNLVNESANYESGTLEDDSNSSDDDKNCNLKISSKLEKSAKESNNPDCLDENSIEVIDEIKEIDIVDVIVPKDGDIKCPRRSKKVKVLDEDSNSNDCCVVYENKIVKETESKVREKLQSHKETESKVEKKPQSHKETENKVEKKPQSDNEDSSGDSIIYLTDVIPLKCNEKKSCISKIKDDVEKDEIESSNMEISSSIPSFQPNGGFVCESEAEEEVDAVKAAESKIMLVDKLYSVSGGGKYNSSESAEEEVDAVKAAESKIMQINKKISISRIEKELPVDSEASFEALPVRKEKDADAQQFNFTFDNPSVSQQENGSAVFTSQDVENICSGAFKNMSQKIRSAEDDDSHVPDFCEPKERDFIEMEAELSGDDDSDDDDDEQDNTEDNDILDMVDDGDVPNAEELREDIAGFFMKQKRNEDSMQLHLIQEQIIPEGELNNSGNERKRKFVWQNKDNQESGVVNEVESDDSDEDDETLILNKEKNKFIKEKKEDELESYSSSSYKKSNLKIKILGKPEFFPEPESSTAVLNMSKKRSVYMNLDKKEAYQITKKLKLDDEGSRATRHVIFTATDDDSALKKKNTKEGVCASVFSKLK